MRHNTMQMATEVAATRLQSLGFNPKLLTEHVFPEDGSLPRWQLPDRGEPVAEALGSDPPAGEAAAAGVATRPQQESTAPDGAGQVLEGAEGAAQTREAAPQPVPDSVHMGRTAISQHPGVAGRRDGMFST